MTYPSLPPDLMMVLNRELAGERILWAGQPSPRITFWKSAPILLFGVPWLVFSAGAEIMAIAALFGHPTAKETVSGAAMSYIFPIFLVPFVAVGLGIVSAPFWVARKARRTVHVLTAKRLLTLELGHTLKVSSTDPRQVLSVERAERPDGSGTITFSFGSMLDSSGDRVEKGESWIGVPDVKALDVALHRIVESLKQQA